VRPRCGAQGRLAGIRDDRQGGRTLRRSGRRRSEAHPGEESNAAGGDAAGKQLSRQDAAIHSVGSWSYVFARPGLPDEQAYLLARALHRAEGPLAARLEQPGKVRPQISSRPRRA